MVVTSEESLKILLEKVPHCELHGERIDCRFATRQNLTMFEDTANKRKSITMLRKYCWFYVILQIINMNVIFHKNNVFSAGIPMRAQSKDPNDPEPLEKIPSLLSQEPSPPPIPPLFPSNRFPSLPSPFLGRPPPLFPHMLPNIPPPLPPPLFPPPPIHILSQPPPSLHTNPALVNPAQDGHSSKAYSQQKWDPFIFIAFANYKELKLKIPRHREE